MVRGQFLSLSFLTRNAFLKTRKRLISTLNRRRFSDFNFASEPAGASQTSAERQNCGLDEMLLISKTIFMSCHLFYCAYDSHSSTLLENEAHALYRFIINNARMNYEHMFCRQLSHEITKKAIKDANFMHIYICIIL